MGAQTGHFIGGKRLAIAEVWDVPRLVDLELPQRRLPARCAGTGQLHRQILPRAHRQQRQRRPRDQLRWSRWHRVRVRLRRKRLVRQPVRGGFSQRGPALPGGRPERHPSATSNDILFKFNAGTLDFDWLIPCGIGSNLPYVTGIASDSAGGVFVGGYLTNATTTFGSHSVTLTGSMSPYLVRFSSSGTAQWAVSPVSSRTARSLPTASKASPPTARAGRGSPPTICPATAR